MGLGNAQVGQQEGARLGRHRRPAVSVNRELITADALTGARLADELLGQRGSTVSGRQT